MFVVSMRKATAHTGHIGSAQSSNKAKQLKSFKTKLMQKQKFSIKNQKISIVVYAAVKLYALCFAVP